MLPSEILESSVQMLKTPLTPEAQTQKSLLINFTCLDSQDLESKNVLQEKTQKTFTETLLWGYLVSSVCVILDKRPLLMRGKITNVYSGVMWHGSSPDCERHEFLTMH